jgi:lectin, mannose-binding 2
MPQLRTHSLSAPYLDSDMSSRWWDFGGDTLIRADKYVRLAADQPSQSGWIFSRIPLTANNWEIEMEFSIAGKGNLHGDGFAMWITKERAQPGDVFGHVDRFEGLGIFFDTYKNNRPGVVFPYVMAMMGDGKTQYDRANDGKANEMGGCSVGQEDARMSTTNNPQARGLRGSAVPTKARLTYVKEESLSMELQYKTEGTWTKCFDIKATDAQPLKLPNQAYLGFSAHTGELSDNFDIIDVQTKNLYSPKPSSGRQNQPKTASSYTRGQQESGGWLWFFFKLILFIGLCAGAYFGYNAYRTKQRYSRF